MASSQREQARRVLEHVVLQSVRVTSVNARSETPADDETLEIGAQVDVSAKQGLQSIVIHTDYRCTASRSGQASPGWVVEVGLDAQFGTDEPELPEFTDDQRQAFAILVGVMTLHPYARQFIQSTVSQMGYPAFTLELLVMPPEPDESAVRDE